MFGRFSEEAQKVLVNAKKEMYDLKHQYIGSEHIILSILKNDNDLSDKFKKYKVTYKKYKEQVVNVLGVGEKSNDLIIYTDLLKRILENLIIDSKETNDEITTVSLILSILNEGEGVGIRILLSLGFLLMNYFPL